MTVENWILLWNLLLWVSGGAFAAVTAYVAIRSARGLFGR